MCNISDLLVEESEELRRKDEEWNEEWHEGRNRRVLTA